MLLLGSCTGRHLACETSRGRSGMQCKAFSEGPQLNRFSCGQLLSAAWVIHGFNFLVTPAVIVVEQPGRACPRWLWSSLTVESLLLNWPTKKDMNKATEMSSFRRSSMARRDCFHLSCAVRDSMRSFFRRCGTVVPASSGHPVCEFIRPLRVFAATRPTSQLRRRPLRASGSPLWALR